MRFEFRGKAFFLTYARTNATDLTKFKDEIFERFRGIGGVPIKYVVARERHELPDLRDQENREEHKGDIREEHHIHCYIGLSFNLRTKREASCLDIGGHHPNVQSARSIHNVVKYIVKEDDYVTNMAREVANHLREPPKSRQELGQELLTGKSVKTLVDENPQLIIGFSRLFQDVLLWEQLNAKPANLEGPCGIWIYGPSGAGKTTIANTKFGNLFEKNNSNWFTGYSQGTHNGIRIDDIDDSWREVFVKLKQWAHEFPFCAQFHGGQFTIRPKHIVVTSNFRLATLAFKFGFTDHTPWTRRFKQYEINHWSEWDEANSDIPRVIGVDSCDTGDELDPIME